MTLELTIVHLYPGMLRTYGDRGNLLALKRRLQWRGQAVRIIEVERGDPLPQDPDLIFIGGGSDRMQGELAKELDGRRSEVSAAVRNGSVVLGVCGGYQLLGHSYTDSSGSTLQGMGLLDVTTTAQMPRLIGRVVVDAIYAGQEMTVVGFENHGGRTFLGPHAAPLGRVRRGQGNNGLDGSEGAVQGSVLGTYLHGPLLPSNPSLSDALLSQAFARSGGAKLSPLDDRLEWVAHAAARTRG
jgi:CobQ-like glutamine amidotransferase family enzyme